MNLFHVEIVVIQFIKKMMRPTLIPLMHFDVTSIVYAKKIRIFIRLVQVLKV
jgi:hypothetical protein